MSHRNRYRRSEKPVYQSLELRRMLAGDIQVAVVDDVLNIVGDSLANEIQVTQNASGAVVVTGVNTTVNGGSTPFTSSNSFQHVSLFLLEGNDTVTLTGLSINSNLSYYGGQGNDRLVVTDTSAYHLHAEGGDGDDVFDMGLAISKSAYLYLGSGDDVVALHSMFAGRNFKVYGGAGNDTFASDNLTVGRKLSLNLDNGNDDVLIAGSTSIRRSAKINTGAGDDFVATTPEATDAFSFRSGLKLDAGGGDDNIALNSNVSLLKRSDINGSAGQDAFSRGNAVLKNTTVSQFESLEVANLQARIDSVFATLTNANIDVTDFGGEVQSDPIQITTSTTPLTFAENSAAIAVDDGIVLTGPDGRSISGATVSLDGFQSDQDVLAFVDTANISGAFNTNDGTLTLTGTDTIAIYQQALRTVTYNNTSENPTSDQRTIRFAITSDDEIADGSRSLNVVAVNDAPTIELQTTSRTVTPGDLPVVLDNALTLTDSDNAQLAQAIVQLGNGRVAGEDVLTFQEQAGITTTFDASTGTLTMSGTGGVAADIADYQTLLRSVAYNNSSSTPTAGTRTIRFTIGDGSANDFAEFELQLNDAPT